ncbi:hypothetical protein VOLCADRAFT_95268 [Volvox carteri f. nagariensis]|uniref:Uncharacterized protein n=1 Tax=Volvox carteri f. nagariensis TaxID=3068 RepID=D8U721_VOLCA|nr:uncharacterized protein VOLCADRAFT_95268 [Volvox carteri f. nagariensis]EFJ44539.1 hypothetical protein VOLCADRAFT_95268 [Volvox carteri f. nagariensis]|eukprot:XP_002954389.1 hypothetical protein VOLCADRAFT_95268 [Volvox carteri f. nagariensis]
MHDRVRMSSGRPADLLLPDINIVHIKRCSPVHPKHLCRQAEELGVGFKSRVVARTETPRPAALELTREMSVPEVMTWLQEDIAELISVFGEQLGGWVDGRVGGWAGYQVAGGRYSRVSAKLEVLGSTPCPRFHADHVGIRLLVTYYGPGTVYVENRASLGAFPWGESSGMVGRGTCAAAGYGAAVEAPDDGMTTYTYPYSSCWGRGPANKTHDDERLGRLGKHGISQPLRLLLTVDDVVGHTGSGCGCGQVHEGQPEGRGRGQEAAAAAAGGMVQGEEVVEEARIRHYVGHYWW